MSIDERITKLNDSLSSCERQKDEIITQAVFRGISGNRELKDSGTSYLGLIPVEWKVKKINELYDLRVTKVSDVDYPPLSVTMKGIMLQLETVAKTNAHDDRKLVRKGDFVINSRSDRRNSCGVSSYDGSVSLINTVLKPCTDMNYEYFDWLFHTMQFADEFYRWGHGIVDDLWTTGWEDMKNILLPVPPIKEQIAIAEYLNKKCAEIEDVIADIKAQIETLKQSKKSLITEIITRGLNPNIRFKDSGIIWIGEIPEHWKVIRNGYILDKRKLLVGEKWETTQLLSLTKQGIVEKDIDEGGGKQPTSFSTYQFVEKGDLILCLFDLDCSAVFSGLSGYNGMISPAYKRYICKKGGYNEYFKFFFEAAFVGRHYMMYSKSLRYTIDDDIFDSLYSILPPIEEQIEIAEYLNKKCAEIEDVIADKEEQLDVLESYKKSLIFEIVTGKRGV